MNIETEYLWTMEKNMRTHNLIHTYLHTFMYACTKKTCIYIYVCWYISLYSLVEDCFSQETIQSPSKGREEFSSKSLNIHFNQYLKFFIKYL